MLKEIIWLAKYLNFKNRVSFFEINREFFCVCCSIIQTRIKWMLVLGKKRISITLLSRILNSYDENSGHTIIQVYKNIALPDVFTIYFVIYIGSS